MLLLNKYLADHVPGRVFVVVILKRFAERRGSCYSVGIRVVPWNAFGLKQKGQKGERKKKDTDFLFTKKSFLRLEFYAAVRNG
jgi:hypothetical protein